MFNKELDAALTVVGENFQREMANLEAVNIGSAYRTKSQIIVDISTKAIEIRDFIAYGLSLIDFINKGGTFEGFIDNQLSFIAECAKPGHDKRSKDHWVNLLYKLYPEVIEKLEEINQ